MMKVATVAATSLITFVVLLRDLFDLAVYYALSLTGTLPLLSNNHPLEFQDKLKMKGRILVYSIVGCPHCIRAKTFLQERRLVFTEVRLDLYDEHVRTELKQRTGRSTVPQIFFNNTHVGGNDDLEKLGNDKVQFDRLLQDITDNEPPNDAPQVPDESLLLSDAQGSEIDCNPDEYADLVKSLKVSGLISDHRSGLKVHKDTFVGKEFVDWIVKTKQLDRESAVVLGQQLIDSQFGHQVVHEVTFQDSDKAYYRLLEDRPTSALNASTVSYCKPVSADNLGTELRKMILKIYSSYLSKDGKKVNYDGIGKSNEFADYVTVSQQLQRVRIQDASTEVKLAFFINIYNALVIHATVERGPPTSLWQRYKFFNTMRYLIGGHEYSLQDIENGILRANRIGQGMITKPFGKNDPRLNVALSQPEPLIHFALVCGAKSCPPIKTYSAEGIYDQLKLAAESFLEGSGCEVDLPKREVKLSQILKWYREDFGSNNAEMLEWVCRHMTDGTKKSALRELLDANNYKLSFMPYDWATNS